ncbi:hypothetical protein LOD99_13540 [Oopsacas minuta]|uniref:F-box domain-containing protein n=1 Tax=Oopsacas minuta TaxID=111878 RepID=A0AAV7KK36_9METZ|nr:hypothetical protein LOD99_13540 [Oopsacas minuta]
MAVANAELNMRHRLLLHFPLEVLYRILNYLELRDILAFRNTCKSFYSICQSPAAYEHLTIDRSINFKNLTRKSDKSYFANTRFICWKGSPKKLHNFSDLKLQSFPKLTSLDLSHSPIYMKHLCKLDNKFGYLKSVKLCMSMPHGFSGYSVGLYNQLKLVLIHFLSQLLQTNTIESVRLLFTLETTISDISSTTSVSDLCLDLKRMPRKVIIENFALFCFKVTNPSILYSQSHGIEEFVIRQSDSGYGIFTIPITFSLPAECDPSPQNIRSIYLEHNTIPKIISIQDMNCIDETNFHRQYKDLNYLPEPFLEWIDYGKLCFLDLSRMSSSVTTKINLDLLYNLRDLNIFGQSSILLHILDQVHIRVLFPNLKELNIGGIQCCQLFDRVRKQILWLSISQLTSLRALTLTPCMTLLPSNSIFKDNFNSNAYQPLKLRKMETYGICVPYLFRSCPYLERFTVTDKSLVRCQLCTEEYANLKQTRKFLNPVSSITEFPLTYFSLYYKQGVIDNFSTLLLEEIASLQLTNLTHFSIQTNRNFLSNILCRFIHDNSDLITLRIDCSMHFTPLIFKSLKLLKYLENLFLIGSNASELNLLESVIAEQPLLSLVWLHFQGLTAKQGKELQTRLLQLKQVRAVQDDNLTVHYGIREYLLPDNMYSVITGYLYSKSGISK